MTSSQPTHDPEETDEPLSTRRQYLGGIALGGATALSPLTAFQSDATTGSLTELATTYDPLVGSGTGTDLAIEHGSDKTPSWTVQYSDGKRDSLTTWLENSDKRRLLSEHQPSNSATVIASPKAMGARWQDRRLGNGLAARDYIELVDLNIETAYAKPIDTLATTISDGAVGLGEWERRLWGSDAPLPDATGLAMSGDAPKVTPYDVAQIINADTEAVESVDTSGITVAVVDTGFNAATGDILGDRPSDADYSPRLLAASKSELTGQTVADDGLSAITDNNDHGSFVASEILSNPTNDAFDGIAHTPDLLTIKALDSKGSGSMSDIANGVRYAADNGADVICMSLGSPIYAAEIHRALAYAVDEGSIPVVAAGNDRQGSRWIATPASSEYAIGVAATNGRPAADAESAYFSNLAPHPGTTDLSKGETNGAGPDVAAPGMAIKALVGKPNGSTVEQTKSGTSMAAPFVAGVVTLLIASDSALAGDFEAVRQRLRTHARPIPNAGTTEVGAGMVDAHAAITETETGDQSDQMTERAFTRNEGYQKLSRQQGGAFARFL